jgi:hypothetical protein
MVVTHDTPWRSSSAESFDIGSLHWDCLLKEVCGYIRDQRYMAGVTFPFPGLCHYPSLHLEGLRGIAI